MFTVYFLIAGLVLLLFWIFSEEVCTKEALLQLTAQSVLIMLMCFLIKNAHLSDKEIINGKITSKDSAKVTCRHTYSCNCSTICTGSGNSRSCSRVCQTCREHFYDVDWFADDSTNNRTYISKVDRRGLKEPPRWSRIYIGEPVSHLSSYQNYIKADPDSLFKHESSNLDPNIFPAYPNKVYDYYVVDRLVSYKEIGSKEWNKLLRELNADIGPTVKANFILVVTDKPSNWSKSLQRFWEGGKKNDIILVVGSVGESISWSDVIGLSYPDFKVKLRNRVNEYGKLDKNLLPVIRETILRDFKRRPMSEFEYLKESYKPTLGEWLLGAFISLILSIGLGIFFHMNEFFPRNRFNTRRFRR